MIRSDTVFHASLIVLGIGVVGWLVWLVFLLTVTWWGNRLTEIRP